MGKKSKSSSDKKKKKGPKGKRARAKAKLERQWGEEDHGDEEDTSTTRLNSTTKRVGKSRILSTSYSRSRGNSSKSREDSVSNDDDYNNSVAADDTAVDPLIIQNDDHDDDDESNDEEEEDDEEMDLTNGGPYYKLLNTIRRNKNQLGDSGSDEEAEEEDIDMYRKQSVDDSSYSGDSDGDNNYNTTNMELEATFDPFGSRFSKEALPEDDVKREEMLQKLQQQTKKVSVPHIHPLLELQVSQQLLTEIIHADANSSDNDHNKNNDKDKSNDMLSKQFWKKQAGDSFVCNRDVLKRSWKQSNNNKNKKKDTILSPWQSVLYPFVTRYADCLITCCKNNDSLSSFSSSSASKKQPAQQVAHMVLLHLINHVLTSRGRIQRQNRRIKQQNDQDEEKEEEPIIKDQGYTRPTVLVLLPTRGTCHTFVHQMLNLLGGGGNVPEEYMERFDVEYGVPREEEAGEEEEEGDDDDALRKRRRRRRKVLEEKGTAWQSLFGDDVNSDDDFKIGIALNAKAAVTAKKKAHDQQQSNKATATETTAGVNAKLYTDFYSSDIIVASPLGLRMAISSSSSSDSNNEEGGGGDCDFLSSIEICFMDRSDVMMMQNWDHVNDVLEHLNRLPTNNNETDFARVRDYFLVNQAAHWRQLILLTEILDPAILSTFKRFAKSHGGVLKTRQRVSEDEGSIANVILPVRQVFQRIPVQGITTMSEDRMKYMIQNILPSILQHVQKHTLIYTPSYFDFVLIRNHLIKNDAQFVSVTEYSRVSETSRGRARFHQGHKPLMLYTGRAHFFLRHKIKGIRHLIVFGLPEHSEFYADLVNVINEGLHDEEEHMGAMDSSSGDATAASCAALFTKFEAHALERIVGTSQANRMIKGDKSTFTFVS